MEKKPLATALVLVKIGSKLMAARLGGGYKDNPFFETGSATPVRQPQVISKEERDRLY